MKTAGQFLSGLAFLFLLRPVKTLAGQVGNGSMTQDGSKNSDLPGFDQ
ncbi:hypothetical protein [Larkinella arboricola]